MTTKPTSRGVQAPDYDDFTDGIPLWSEILPNLWQGGTHDDDIIGNDTFVKLFADDDAAFITPDNFDTVVSLYQYSNPVGWFVKEYRYCVYDWTIEHMNLDEVFATARFAHAEWKQGKRVLIRCQAGLNRSSLIMALVLMYEGLTAENAVKLIRAKRSPYCLFNREFEKFLNSLDSTQLPTH